jgi:hypothetical protein
MAKIVELPDGRKAEFPDSMSNEKIADVLSKQFGGQQDSQQDEQAREFRPGFVPPPESRRMERQIEKEKSFGAAYNPRSLDQRREDFLKEQQNILERTKEDIKQEKERKYYASEFFNQFDFGKSDIGFYERNRIAAADNFEEKQNQFARLYPEGDLQRIPVTGELVFRREPSESYRKLNPEGADPTDLAYLAGEYGPVTLGEILGSSLSFNRRSGQIEGLPKGSALGKPRRVMSTLAKGGLGAAVFEAGSQAFQFSTGVQEDPWATALLRRPATEGLITIVGGAAAEPVFRGVDVALGSGIYTPTQQGARGMAAADRLGLPQPLPGQTTGSNFVTRVQGQAGQLTPKIDNYLADANTRAVSALNNIAELTPTQRRAAINTIQNGLDQEKANLVRSLGRPANVSNQEYGQYVKNAYDQFYERTKTDVANVYAVAKSYLTEGDQIKFDISNLKTEAGRIADTTKVTVVRDGQAAPEEITNEALSEVRDLARQIRDSDPESVTPEVMMAWEDRLSELSTPPLDGDPSVARRPMLRGGYTEANQKAITLKKFLKESFDNPLNRGKEFGEAWQKARSAAISRADALNDAFSMYIAKTQEPSVVANYIFNPENIKPENVRAMFRLMDETQRDAVQAGFLGKFLRNPDKINESLDTFDEDVLTLMLSPNEVKRLRETGRIISNLDNSGIGRVLSRQEEFVPFFQELVTRNPQTVQTGNLFQLVQRRGGINSPEGRAIKGALVEAIARDAVSLTGSKGNRQVSSGTLDQALSNYEDRNLLRFLSEDDVNNLRDLFDYVGTIQPQGEGVAGLIGAQTVSQATRLEPTALTTLLRQVGVGNLIVSGIGKRVLQGTVKGRIVPRNAGVPLITTLERILVDQALAGNSGELPELSEMEESSNIAPSGVVQ